MTDETTNESDAPRGRGWPKGKPRGPRAEAAPQRSPQRAPQGGKRTRTGRMAMTNDDVYAIDRSTLPEHMDYQWVTKSVIGDESGKVRADFVKFTMNGWTPVDASRLPQYGIDTGEINLGGLVLMERPMEMSEEARQEDADRARGQVMNQMNLINGTPERLNIRKGGEQVREMPRSVGRGEPIPVRSDSVYERE